LVKSLEKRLDKLDKFHVLQSTSQLECKPMRERGIAWTWGGELFVDFERGLNVCIQQIRGALNDEADAPRYIETLPKRGYRFLAAVEKLENPVQTARPAVASQQITAVPSTHLKVKRLRLAVAFVSVVLLISALLYFAKISNRFPFRTAAKSIRSVAVLPFDNFSGDPERQYFADGMTEALIAELGQIRDLRVPSRTSEPLRQIAQELTVDALLEGSVTRFGDRVEITVQLLDGLRDQHLSGGTYDRDFRDVLALQHELARAITAELKISFSPQEHQHLKSSAPVNADAYAAYLHGRYYWYKRTIEGFQKSIQYYGQAVAADPNYAPAYAGLADASALLCSALLCSSPNDGLPPYEGMPKAKAAAQKALQLDDGLAEAHASLAYINMVYDWNWTSAEKEFQRAIELNPNYAGAHEWFAEFLAARGRESEALSEMKRARDADPLLVLMHAAVAEALYYSRRYDDVISQCQQTLELDPDYPLAHFHLGRAYMGKNMYPEAIAEYRKAQASLGVTPAILMAMGMRMRRQATVQRPGRHSKNCSCNPNEGTFPRSILLRSIPGLAIRMPVCRGLRKRIRSIPTPDLSKCRPHGRHSAGQSAFPGNPAKDRYRQQFQTYRTRSERVVATI
jgi:TolB-like protein/Tfp pilus assembly protein PilF